MFRIGCASQQVPGRQVLVYKVCEVQVDEVSEMRRDDTQAQERKEVEWGRRAGVGPFSHGNVLHLVFSDMW